MAFMGTERASSSSSSSIVSGFKYDVFLSFRGSDTRKNFTDHLYAALNQKGIYTFRDDENFERGTFIGIYTFRDDEKLERGTFIAPELLRAIEESRFAVVIISQDYASSRWCLVELAKIVECMEKDRLIVLPVFHYIDPSDVRNLKKTFGEAFAKHEERYKDNIEEVHRWKAALTKVASIAGWDLQDRHEANVVEEIVRKISNKLISTYSIVHKDFVGINSRMEELVNLLGVGLNDVRFIGIWGMGGLGKTTLARVVYDRFRHHFEGSSFLANVREECEKHGFVHLQKQLLSDILFERNIDFSDVQWGSNVIEKRLCYKSVIIVLDDVDQIEQLEALAGERVWFGQGSRVIITTRDQHLLINHDVAEAEIYKAKELNSDEALQLFSRKAFKKDHPSKGYVELSKKAICYAQGLPLALEVLGSFLKHRNPNAWESALGRLEETPQKKILDTLQISFDGLEETEKKIFLDIACFFKGKDKDRVTNILQTPHYKPNIDIDVLVEKSLITILGRNLWMHDLLQELGRQIVHRESPEQPGSRSRLWLKEDVLHVLKYSTGTERVETIALHTPPQEEIHLNPKAFSKMTRLRLLEIHNVHISQDLNYLSNELHFMEWHGYPLESIPINFEPEKLVELIMCCSRIKQLWKGIKNLKRLKLIDLSDSQNLIMTPDFSGVPNLEKLILQGCTKLSKIHASVGNLKHLILLNLKDCKSLYSLSCKISLESLEIFILSGCSRLEKFPEIEGDMTRLTHLYLDGTAIRKLPLSMERLTGLTLFNLSNCKHLSSLPGVLCSLLSLKTLTLSGCSKLGEMPENLGDAEGLEELDISGTAIRKAPSSILLLKNLKLLSFHGCKGPPPKPWLLNCLLPSPDVSLMLPTSFSGLCSLTVLDLRDCNLLDGEIPNDFSGLSSLQYLDLSGNNFTSLPDSISELSQLRHLTVNDCSRLKSLPKLPISIFAVVANDCASLETDSNEVNVWTSSETGPAIIYCSRSTDHLEGNKTHKISLPDPLSYSLLQRGLEFDTYFARVLYGIATIGVLKWFNFPIANDSILQLLPNLDANGDWMGCALCFFAIHDEHLNSNSRTSGGFDSFCDSDKLHQIDVHFEADDGGVKQPLVQRITISIPIDQPRGFWVYIPRVFFSMQSNLSNKWSFIEPSITSRSPGMQVKLCAGRLLYEQDFVEFEQAISGHYSQNLKDRHPICHENIEMLNSRRHAGAAESSESNLLEPECTSMGAFSNQIEECTQQGIESAKCGSGSIIQLKRDLQALLLRCYEVNNAQNKMYKYIFPLSKSLYWFKYHSLEPFIMIHLPPNLYDDKSWIGFSLCARYAVQKHPSTVSYEDLNSKNSHNFHCYLGTNDKYPNPVIIFPLSRDIFLESHRLLVLHIPRVFFTDKLNQQCCIWATFGAFSPGLNVEMCGIRLVYEKDLEGFVQTIVDDCILANPNIYHQHYYQSLEDQVDNLPCYVPEAEYSDCNPLEEQMPSNFGYSFPLQRWVCALLGIDSGIGGATRDSNSSSIQLSILDENELSNCINRGLEHWFQSYFQGYSRQRYIYNDCFPKCEIPEWFCHQSGSLLRIQLPPNLYTNSDWVGIALFATFTVHKHPTLILDNSGTEISHGFSCSLRSDMGSWTMSNKHYITESEHNKFIWLKQRKFIWIMHVPHARFLDKLNCSNLLTALFGSDSQDLMVQNCGYGLVYQQNVGELVQTLVQCSTMFSDNSDLIRQFTAHQSRTKQQSHDDDDNVEGETSGTGGSNGTLRGLQEKIKQQSHDDEGEGETSGTGRYNGTLRVPHYQENVCATCYQKFIDAGGPTHYCHRRERSEEFHLHYPYDRCFPPTKIPELFSHYAFGSSMAIQLPSNLHNDSNWLGFAICAAFSVQEYPTEFLDNLETEIPHHLSCLFDMDISGLKPLHVYSTFKEELKWLHLHGFIWLSYIPYWCLSDKVNQCNHIEVSIASDWPGWIVRKCGLRLVYLQDEREFWQIRFHLRASLYDNWDIICEDLVEQRPLKSSSKASSTQTLSMNKCFPQSEIPEWFMHQSTGPSLSIQLPSNFSNASTWIGLVLCASFSVNEHPTITSDNLDSDISHHLICHLDAEKGSLESPLLYQITEENFTWLNIQGFIWLYYIPRGSLSDFFNRSSQIEVSIGSDFPDLMVKKCGQRFLYHRDVEEFEKTIIKCSTVPFYNMELIHQSLASDSPNDKPKNEAGCSYEDPNLGGLRRPIFPEQSSRDSIYLEDQHPNNQLSKSDLQEFDRSLVYNSCFPPSEILEWFNHRSGEPPVTIHLPPNLYDDSSWRGLALCVSFSVNIKDPTAILDILNSENAHHLYCHLESNVGSLEPLHAYCLTKEDVMLLHLGGFRWLSYIPRSSFPDWLNQCNHIEASIVSDCPDLTVVKCGLRLVHQHDEEEFKQTTRHGLASLSDNWGLILHLTTQSRKTNKQNLSMLKEKGKHVLE